MIGVVSDAAVARRREAPSPAVAPPPGSPRFALFDALRGIAVLSVIAFHVSSVTGALDAGRAGDALTILGPQALLLFFVISGFLLYRPFVAARARGAPPPSARRYGRRRVLRIVPAYWVALTVLAIFPGIVGVFTSDWWRYYGFLQLYWSDTVGGGIPVAWSLSVEVSFYVLLPLWALLARRAALGRGPRGWVRGELAALTCVAAFGAAVQVAAARNVVPDLAASTLLGQCTWLALGMALAVLSVAADHGELVRVARTVGARPGLCWAGALGAFLGLVVVLKPEGLAGIVGSLTTRQPVDRTLAAIALGIALNALLVAPAVFGERAGGIPRRVLAFGPLTGLGVVSYGAYLWHLTIIELLALPADPAHFSAAGLGLADRIDRFTTPILFVLSVAASALVAALSYRFVELPFLRRKEG